MKLFRVKTTLLCCLILLSSLPSFSQPQPQPPEISFVSVDPQTGAIHIEWYKSPAKNVAIVTLKFVSLFIPSQPKGYIIKTYIKNVDSSFTALPSTISAIDTIPMNHALSFAIDATVNGVESSGLNLYHSMIFATAESQNCPNQIVLTWNKYHGPDVTVNNYSIYSYNDSVSTMIGSVSGNDTTYAVPISQSSGTFCYYIGAAMTSTDPNTNVSKSVVSTSYRTCATINLPTLPKFMIANYATTISDNQVNLSFSVDTGADVKHFKIVSSSSINGIYSAVDSADFKHVTTPTISFSYKKIGIGLIPTYFRLYAINSCGDSVLSSNVASNIVLNVEETSKNNIIKWNAYQKWNNGVDKYELYRSVDDNALSLVETFSNISDTTYSYNDLLELFATEGNKACYQIIAYPINPFYASSKSQSNEVCVTPDARIFVPDAFNPVSKVEKNRLFKPEMSFVDLKDYYFAVYSRWSEIMFSTTDYTKAWDGTYKNSPVSEGTFIYYIKYNNSTGKTIEKRGTFDVIYNER